LGKLLHAAPDDGRKVRRFMFGLDRSRHGVHMELDLAPLLAPAQFGQANTTRHPVHPGGKLAVAAEPLEHTDGFQKGLLRHILRGAAVAHETKGQIVYDALVPPHQFRKCLDIALLRGLNQREVGHQRTGLGNRASPYRCPRRHIGSSYSTDPAPITLNQAMATLFQFRSVAPATCPPDSTSISHNPDTAVHGFHGNHGPAVADIAAQMTPAVTALSIAHRYVRAH